MWVILSHFSVLSIRYTHILIFNENSIKHVISYYTLLDINDFFIQGPKQRRRFVEHVIRSCGAIRRYSTLERNWFVSNFDRYETLHYKRNVTKRVTTGIYFVIRLPWKIEVRMTHYNKSESCLYINVNLVVEWLNFF